MSALEEVGAQRGSRCHEGQVDAEKCLLIHSQHAPGMVEIREPKSSEIHGRQITRVQQVWATVAARDFACSSGRTPQLHEVLARGHKPLPDDMAASFFVRRFQVGPAE